MPLMQSATSSMNSAFAPDAVSEIDGDTAAGYHPDSGSSLSEALDRTPKTDLSDAVKSFIDGWPGALQAAVKATIHHNLTRDARVPITFAWQPGYDFSITLHDVTDTATSHGGITVLLTSRYPNDTHPLGGASAS
jgi:hypothetical protein